MLIPVSQHFSRSRNLRAGRHICDVAITYRLQGLPCLVYMTVCLHDMRVQAYVIVLTWHGVPKSHVSRLSTDVDQYFINKNNTDKNGAAPQARRDDKTMLPVLETLELILCKHCWTLQRRYCSLARTYVQTSHEESSTPYTKITNHPYSNMFIQRPASRIYTSSLTFW